MLPFGPGWRNEPPINSDRNKPMSAQYQLDIRLSIVSEEPSPAEAQLAASTIAAKCMAEVLPGHNVTQIATHVFRIPDEPPRFEPRQVG